MIKELVGLAKSKYSRMKADNALTEKLNSDIGSSSVIGQENFNKQYRTIKGLVNAGKQQEAVRYSRSQAVKVNREVFNERKGRLNK